MQCSLVSLKKLEKMQRGNSKERTWYQGRSLAKDKKKWGEVVYGKQQ